MQVHIHDGQDVCCWINLETTILPAFPQLFTISDWRTFIKEAISTGVYTRSEIALRLAAKEARVFSPTVAYYKAREKLRRHSFVVLEGPPEMGKTTIARLITVAQVALGWEAIECRTPKELLDTISPDRLQIFLADDFFGRSEYEASRLGPWQAELPYILERLDHDHWLVLTSRAHILNMAKHTLDIAGQNGRFPDLSEVVVNAGDLSVIEKGKILYRHVKAAGLEEGIRDYLREHAEAIVENPHFTPLRIKRFVESLK